MTTDVISAHPSDTLLDRVASAMATADVSTLRRRLLDDRRRSLAAPRDDDRVARMLLYLDEPNEVLALGLEHVADTLGCERADAGLLDETDGEYRPTAVVADSVDVRRAIASTPLPNRHPVLRAVWRSPEALGFERVEGNPHLGSLEPVFAGLGTQAMLASPIRHGSVGLGLLCVDETETRRFSTSERCWLDRFVGERLAPVLAASLRRCSSRSVRLSAAEAEAVALLACGQSYVEIGRTLGKSERTIDNQLRSARRKTGARNAVELVRWWNDSIG